LDYRGWLWIQAPERVRCPFETPLGVLRGVARGDESRLIGDHDRLHPVAYASLNSTRSPRPLAAEARPVRRADPTEAASRRPCPRRRSRSRPAPTRAGPRHPSRAARPTAAQTRTAARGPWHSQVPWLPWAAPPWARLVSNQRPLACEASGASPRSSCKWSGGTGDRGSLRRRRYVRGLRRITRDLGSRTPLLPNGSRLVAASVRAGILGGRCRRRTWRS
jgi:hypothetical protein